MTDLITRARKAWCVPFTLHPRPIWKRCHPKVIAALLEVLIDYAGTAYCGACGKLAHMKEHDPRCSVGIAEAAITRALEGK